MSDIDLIKFWIVNPEPKQRIEYIVEYALFSNQKDQYNYINRLKEDAYSTYIKNRIDISLGIMIAHTNIYRSKKIWEFHKRAIKLRADCLNFEKLLLEVENELERRDKL